MAENQKSAFCVLNGDENAVAEFSVRGFCLSDGRESGTKKNKSEADHHRQSQEAQHHDGVGENNIENDGQRRGAENELQSLCRDERARSRVGGLERNGRKEARIEAQEKKSHDRGNDTKRKHIYFANEIFYSCLILFACAAVPDQSDNDKYDDDKEEDEQRTSHDASSFY